MATPSNWRLLLALALGAIACWLTLSDASAHAAYESSSPAFAEQLGESPNEITIRFTQELFRRSGANTIALTNADRGSDIRLGEPQISNEDRRVMTISVEESLPPGRYLVSWTNLSAEDGDTDSGSYPFYVSRSPSPTEVEQDRQAAVDLLITYSDDETEPAADEAQTQPRAPTVVRAETSDAPGLGVAPLIWLALGLLAGLALIGALGYHLGRRGRVR